MDLETVSNYDEVKNTIKEKVLKFAPFFAILLAFVYLECLVYS